MPYLIKTILVRSCERTDGPIEQRDARFLTTRRYVLQNGLLIQRTRFEPQAVEAVWQVPGPGERVRLADMVEEQGGCVEAKQISD